MSKELEEKKYINGTIEWALDHLDFSDICDDAKLVIKQALIDKDNRIKELGAYVDILLKDANEGMKIANQDLQDKLDKIEEVINMYSHVKTSESYSASCLYKELESILKESK